MHPLNTLSFDCPRTCRTFERRDLCRFNPILSALGPVVVNSHTARVKVDYDDPAALECAVRRMNGIWYGKGHFDLGDTQQDGYGFRLPMPNGYHEVDGKTYWYHELVVRADGEIAFDAFGESWGRMQDLETLKAEYACALVETRAAALGWLCERTPDGIVVFHPDAGTLTLHKDGTVATAGFQGGACHSAREALGLTVEAGSIINTAEYCAVPVQVSQGN